MAPDNGIADQTNSNWAVDDNWACNTTRHLYCFEQPPPKKVFATSTTSNGNLGGVAGANAICAARATAAGLSGTFLAWIATSAADDPESRFTPFSGQYVLTNGTKIADSWTDLTDGSLDAGINRDEFGASIIGGTAHTAVGTNGTYDSSLSCLGWTNGTSGQSGKDGSLGQTNSWWTSSNITGCHTTKRLLCFEQ
jgi:hypothetical protein